MQNKKKYKYPRSKKYKGKKRVKIKKKKLLKALLLPVVIFSIIFMGLSLRAALHVNDLETNSNWTKELASLDEEENDEMTTGINTVIANIDLDGKLDYLLLINSEKKEDNKSELTDIDCILIPGKTYLEVPGQGRATLKEAYEWGKEPLLLDTLEEKLNLPLHNFIKINPLLVEKLNEKLALEIETSAFEPETGEDDKILERVYNKEDIIVSIREKYLEKSSFWNRSGYLNEIADYIETNMTWEQAGLYLEAIDEILSGDDKISLIPGQAKSMEGSSYWMLDHENIDEFIGSTILDNYIGRDLEPEEITVEVIGLNQEYAENIKDHLSEKGFMVKNVEVDNNNNQNINTTIDTEDTDSNLVISRKKPKCAAKAVALEVEGANLLNEPDPESSVMVTVIIGEN
ncbi:LCP family protein [Natranaerofaba carboxydovora]|uniref:LCP family protein n=1 Tax=Natranaerofaba carboxydovora TaxID=2742683 RepID=UPI001F12E92C|nr:LCP family protein [Natranaerofaba carboxydovora]UMZ72887.1 hypothetical protein ACONDI_00424 [Natranaerofaba carboxydovora]